MGEREEGERGEREGAAERCVSVCVGGGGGGGDIFQELSRTMIQTFTCDLLNFLSP